MSTTLTLDQVTEVERLKLADQLRVLRMVEPIDTHAFRIIETNFNIEFCERMIAHQKRLSGV